MSECTKPIAFVVIQSMCGSITHLKRIEFAIAINADCKYNLNKAKIKTIIGRDQFTRMKCCVVCGVWCVVYIVKCYAIKIYADWYQCPLTLFFPCFLITSHFIFRFNLWKWSNLELTSLNTINLQGIYSIHWIFLMNLFFLFFLLEPNCIR